MSALSEAQHNLIQWLADNGGECVLDKYCRFIAQGERRSNSFAPSIIRLVAAGYIEGAGPNRLRLSALGRSTAKRAGNPTCVPMTRDFSDPRIREKYIGDEDTLTNFADADAASGGQQ